MLHIMMRHMQLIFRDAKSKNVISPSYIAKRLHRIGRTLRLGRQEDAHEFARLLLEAIHNDELKLAGVKENAPGRIAETSMVHTFFGGYLRSQLQYVMLCSAQSPQPCLPPPSGLDSLSGLRALTMDHGPCHVCMCMHCSCPSCGYNSNTYDAMLDLELELSKRITTVNQALQHFAVRPHNK